MQLTLMRVVLGLLFAQLLLVEGVLCRPHSTASTTTAAAAAHGEQQQQQYHVEQRRGNDLSVRHHNNHHTNHHKKAHRPHRHHEIDLADLTDRQVLCGRQLSDFLRNLCRGRGYNSPDNLSGSSTSGRSHGGLATECCNHVGCSLADLEQYCQPRETTPSSESESEESSVETESTKEPQNNEMRQVPMENHIRPVSGTNDLDRDSKRSDMPTVVGERTNVAVNVTVTLKNPKDMIKVGVLPNPYRSHRTPIPARLPAAANTLKSH